MDCFTAVAGANTLVWDGRSDTGSWLSSGVYMVRLQTEAGSASRRVVLQRLPWQEVGHSFFYRNDSVLHNFESTLFVNLKKSICCLDKYRTRLPFPGDGLFQIDKQRQCK